MLLCAAASINLCGGRRPPRKQDARRPLVSLVIVLAAPLFVGALLEQHERREEEEHGAPHGRHAAHVLELGEHGHAADRRVLGHPARARERQAHVD